MANTMVRNESANDTLLEDLVNNMSTLQVSALIRAAKVSPLIKDGRTIGPIEINETPKKSNSKNDKKIIEVNQTNKQKKSTINKGRKLNADFYLSPKNDLLDINVINTSIVAKVTEKNRRENVKKELEQRLKALTVEKFKLQEILDKSRNVQYDWMKKKIESDKEIYQIAEKYVEDEIKQSNKNSEKILNEKQRRLQTIALEAIVQRRKKFTAHYEKVCQSLKMEKNCVECEKYNKSLKELAIDFEKLIQKIKNNNMGQSEILAAESLCERIENLDKNLFEDIKNKKFVENLPQVQQQTQNFNSSIQPEEQQQFVESNTPSIDVPDTTASIEIPSIETLNFYSKIIKFVEEKHETLAQLESDPNMKKFLAACRRNINIPVAAICAVTPQHMQDKFDKIMNFILGNTKKQSASDVHVSEHPLARDYCITYLAKKFVAVAGTEISSNAQAAFPFASIIIAIWNRIPDFGKLFLGQMYKDSVFLVPFLYSKSTFQNDVQYKLAYGYSITENASALEDFSSYNKRQAGIVRLFAAIMISHGRRDDQSHPFPIENGWKWLSNLINIKPEMHDIIATIIVEFLQIAAYEMLSFYGKQFKKLLILIQEKYLPRLDEIEDGKAASKGKLEQTLDLILKHNRVDKPQGMIGKNFW